MYRRTLFLETLHSIREEMSREVDYDVDLFVEKTRSGFRPELVVKKPAVRKKKTATKTKIKS